MKKKEHKHAEVHVAAHDEEMHEEAEGWLISYADMMTLLVGFFVILLSFAKVDDEKFEDVKKAAAKQFGGIYQIPFGELANRLKAMLEKQGLGNQFVIKQTSLGVNISFFGAVFFETGSADIKPDGRNLLDKLIPLMKAEAKDFQVVVEGHTDDVPLSSNGHFKTNWELSGTRASRVINVFETFGYPKSVLTAVGYGEARPIVPNRSPEGAPIEANRAQNRRVVIKLIKPNEKVMESSDSAADTEVSGHS